MSKYIIAIFVLYVFLFLLYVLVKKYREEKDNVEKEKKAKISSITFRYFSFIYYVSGALFLVIIGITSIDISNRQLDLEFLKFKSNIEMWTETEAIVNPIVKNSAEESKEQEIEIPIVKNSAEKSKEQEIETPIVENLAEYKTLYVTNTGYQEEPLDCYIETFLKLNYSNKKPLYFKLIDYFKINNQQILSSRPTRFVNEENLTGLNYYESRIKEKFRTLESNIENMPISKVLEDFVEKSPNEITKESISDYLEEQGFASCKIINLIKIEKGGIKNTLLEGKDNYFYWKFEEDKSNANMVSKKLYAEILEANNNDLIISKNENKLKESYTKIDKIIDDYLELY